MKLVNKIYTSEFFGEFIPVYAIFPIMFVEYGGVSASGVGLLLALWQIVILLSEVPTGIIADKYGRKVSMVLGKVLRILSMLTWLIAPNFTGYLVGFIFLGIGDAFLSGSLEAYTYDEMPDKSSFNKVRQKTVSIHLAAFACAGLVSFMLRADYQKIMIASLILTIVASLFSLLLPTDRVHHKEGVTIKKLLSTARVSIKPKTQAFMPFIRASIVLAAMIVFIEYIGVFYRSTGVSATIVALLMAIGNIVTFVLLWFAHHYDSWFKRWQKQLLIGLSTILGLSIFIPLSIAVQIAGIFFLVRVIRLMNINLSNELQHTVGSDARATIGSLSSFTAKLGASAAMIFVGLTSVEGDIRVSLYIAGVLYIAILLSTYYPRSLKSSNLA